MSTRDNHLIYNNYESSRILVEGQGRPMPWTWWLMNHAGEWTRKQYDLDNLVELENYIKEKGARPTSSILPSDPDADWKRVHLPDYQIDVGEKPWSEEDDLIVHKAGMSIHLRFESSWGGVGKGGPPRPVLSIKVHEMGDSTLALKERFSEEIIITSDNIDEQKRAIDKGMAALDTLVRGHEDATEF